jgi:toxin YoeB
LSRRDAVFDPEFRDGLSYWVRVDARKALRVLSLVEDTLRDPFTGIGKPERLRHLRSNLWSRRMDDTNRLTYLVVEDRITFMTCRYHYNR